MHRSVLGLTLSLFALPAMAQDLAGRWTCEVRAADAGAFLTLDFGRMGSLETAFRLSLSPPRYGLYQIAGTARLRYQTDGPNISQQVQTIRLDPDILAALPVSERGNFTAVLTGVVRDSLDRGAFLRVSDGSLILRAQDPFNGQCQRG